MPGAPPDRSPPSARREKPPSASESSRKPRPAAGPVDEDLDAKGLMLAVVERPHRTVTEYRVPRVAVDIAVGV